MNKEPKDLVDLIEGDYAELERRKEGQKEFDEDGTIVDTVSENPWDMYDED